MKGVDTIARVHREQFVRGKTIKEIARDLHLSRNTVRKILRSGAIAFDYERRVLPRPKLGPWRGELERLLAANAARSSRDRVTLTRLFEDLRGLDFGGGYDAVWRHAARWRRRQSALAAMAFVPLSFAPGEAYQFDWSHEIVVINGVTTIAEVAHMRLCHSRMPLVRAYPRESQEPPRSADLGPFGIGLERLLTFKGFRRPRPGGRSRSSGARARGGSTTTRRSQWIRSSSARNGPIIGAYRRCAGITWSSPCPWPARRA